MAHIDQKETSLNLPMTFPYFYISIFSIMTERKTSELKGILRSSKVEDWDQFSKEFSYPLDWRNYLLSILKEKGMDKSECIRNSGLEIHYAYQILSGVRNPTRDKILALTLGGGLGLDEIDRCLEKGGFQPLYHKNPRDALIACAVNSGVKKVVDLNILLSEKGLSLLE